MSQPAEVRIAYRLLWRSQTRYGVRVTRAEVTPKRIATATRKFDRQTGKPAERYTGGHPAYALGYRVAGGEWVTLNALPENAEVELLNGVMHKPALTAAQATAIFSEAK